MKKVSLNSSNQELLIQEIENENNKEKLHFSEKKILNIVDDENNKLIQQSE